MYMLVKSLFTKKREITNGLKSNKHEYTPRTFYKEASVSVSHSHTEHLGVPMRG